MFIQLSNGETAENFFMKNTKIEWCDHTFSPWIGCTKVSEGCKNCYAEAMNQRFAWCHRLTRHYGTDEYESLPAWGRGVPRKRTSATNWREPFRWNGAAGMDALIAKACRAGHALNMAPVGSPSYEMTKRDAELYGKPPRRPRVFCGSLCDWLDDEVPIEWLRDLLNLIGQTPNIDWLLLTKRPENWEDRLGDVACIKTSIGRSDVAEKWFFRKEPPPNIWLGTTVENQEMADKRIPELLKIPARVRFLSCEPLLGNLDLSLAFQGFDVRPTMPYGEPELFPTETVNWVICGCERARNARPMQTAWALSLKEQCNKAGVAFFMKQMMVDDVVTGDITKFPKELQERSFPK